MKEDGCQGERRGRIPPQHYYLKPAAILALGAVAAGLLFWVYRISERERITYERIDAVMDIEVRTAIFHLWFEEAISDGYLEELSKLWPDLDEATRLSQSLLHGGLSEHGIPLRPFEDPAERRSAEAIESGLVELKALAIERQKDPTAGWIGSPLDEKFDSVFEEVESTARALEVLMEKSQASGYADTARLLFIVALAWATIVAASAIGFFTLGVRRRRAERALEKAYEEMEQRVRERTADLEAANGQLLDEVAERRHAEESLRESREGFRRLSAQFQTLLDTIPDCITLVSRDLKVLWANKGTRGLSGAAEAAVPPMEEYCYTLWHERSVPCDDCPALDTFSTGKPENARVRGPDGRHWEIRSIPVVEDERGIEGVLEVASDVTERIHLQAEAMRAAHLASIGELSAGVAHEINNPVNGIINCAQILCNKSTEGTQERDSTTRILREGHRIGVIVRGLLAFARERKEERSPVALKAILSESLGLVGSQIAKEGIRLVEDVPSDLPKIIANPQEIQQVFLNLISNARYALNQKYLGPDENKLLEIRAEEVAGNGSPHVRIVFRDQGTGIAAHHVDRVMEPFFSTKPAGKGTGLGLSISHGIVSDHGGKLAIESVEGELTSVVIDLPAREGADGTDPRRR